MEDESVDWTKLREFRATDLTKSFVLSWELNGTVLQIDLDVNLNPQHALYEKPRPSEGACFRAALLEFPDCTSVVDVDSRAAPGPLSLFLARLPHGQISGLRLTADGEYELSGEFGTLQIHADRPILRLKSRLD